MILELENRRNQVQTLIAENLTHAAIQSPDDEITTHVAPSDADGDLVVINGLIDINILACSIADALWVDRHS